MEKHIGVWLFVVVFLAGLDSSFTQDKVSKPAYFLVGGDLTLEVGPGVTEPITNILWKHNGNLLAEWIKDQVPLTYYAFFNGITTLDITNGRLEMTKMTAAHNGDYTVEINSKMQSQYYVVKSIEKVRVPEVVLKPIACNREHHEDCKVSCEGNTVGAGPVTYSWRKWVERGTSLEPLPETTKDLDITKTGSADIHYFICNMKNPVSEKESEAKDNPFFNPVKPIPPGPIVGGIIGGIALVAVGAVGYWKRELIKDFCSKPSDNGNVVRTATQPPESVPLNGETAPKNPV